MTERPPNPLAVEGYAGRLSYEPGDIVELHLATTRPHRSGRVAPADTALAVDVEIARVGRDRDTVAHLAGVIAEPHPIPADAAAHGARWPVTTTVTVGDDWRSGWYEVVLRAERPDGSPVERRAGFVVRARTGAADVDDPAGAVDQHVERLQRLGRTQPVHGRHPRVVPAAVRPRPARPTRRACCTATPTPPTSPTWVATRGRHTGAEHSICSWSACAGWPTWEGPFVAWAEAAGYTFDYAVNADLEERPGDRRRPTRWCCRWATTSTGRRPCATPSRRSSAGGGNVAFLSGNTSFWQVRLEDGGDTMVGYKDSARRPRPAPQDRPAPAHLDVVRPDHRPARDAHDRRVVHPRRLRPHRRRHAARPARLHDLATASTGCSPAPTCATATCSAPSTRVVGYECDGCELTLHDGLPVPTHADGCPEGFTCSGRHRPACGRWTPRTA